MIPTNTHRGIPALPRADGVELTAQGLLFSVPSRLGQLLPLCQEPIEWRDGETETPGSGADLQQFHIIRQVQHQRRHQARMYLHLRRHHASPKAQRALRLQLNRFYHLQAEMMEVAG